MRVWAKWAVVWVCVVGTGWGQKSAAFGRAEHLRKGINLSMWYAQSGDYSAARLGTFTTAADFKLIKSLGFDHVRLSIDPVPLIAEAQSGALREEAMVRLDRSVAEIIAAGLNVVLDVHAGEAWLAPLSRGEDGAQRFFAFWGAFAGHFAKTDPERVFFEILNEPTMDDLYRWEGIQARAVARIRAVAPRHTLIATASNYSSVDTLLAMEPVRDENVIYTFHDYNPMWFTHQGANWGTQGWAFLRGVKYPSSPENVLPVLGEEPDERTRLYVQRYGYERWDATRIGAEIAAMAAWGQRRGVPLYCGEFGVYKAYADADSRATWISDMRNALESKGIGWAMWDYQSNFGLVTKGSGGTVVDERVLGALGLKR